MEKTCLNVDSNIFDLSVKSEKQKWITYVVINVSVFNYCLIWKLFKYIMNTL